MTWNAAMASAAQAYASRCVFQHSNSPYGGEQARGAGMA